MHAACIDGLRPFVPQHLDTGNERARRIDDIVHDDHGLAVYFTDQVHRLSYIRLRAALVDDRDRRMQDLRQTARTGHSAMIRRNDDDLPEILFLEILADDADGADVIRRDIEESLDLRRMQLHRDHAVSTGSL